MRVSCSVADYLDPDAKGRIDVVRIVVKAYQADGAIVNPSITMRLIDVALCPSDAIVSD